MEKLSEEQLLVKVAFLAQDNAKLREMLLDYQIRAGDISLVEQGE